MLVHIKTGVTGELKKFDPTKAKDNTISHLLSEIERLSRHVVFLQAELKKARENGKDDNLRHGKFGGTQE
jgi:hypothetical protein